MNLRPYMTVVLIVVAIFMFARQERAIRELRDQVARQPSTTIAPPSTTIAPAPQDSTTETQEPTSAVTPEPAQPPISQEDAEAVRMVAKLARGMAGTESGQMMNIGKQLESNPGQAIEALEDLVPRMDQAKSYQRMELALQMLEQVEPGRSTPALRRLYARGGSSFMQATVAGMLAKRGDDSTLQDFLSDLATREIRSPDPTVRRRAVGALAQTKNPLSTPYIVGMLKDENLQVRIQATYALGTVKGEAAIQELYKLQENPSPAVRDAANRSLEELARAE